MSLIPGSQQFKFSRPGFGLAKAANQGDESGPVLGGWFRHHKPLEDIGNFALGCNLI